ncbi:hypothetical protein CXG81DRAFT_8412 [Caulochytrium protostelioides]|uniref:N-acetylgalactosaminide beta-1,3-galactosyltransferase n=1 Tax=Caulochytrium protostelioides TaxID=1555241 RepID=A0A4P9XGJ7_9FUNG|nr:hypothetical protein CXG81DRAFT_8412 [Caulochytrium protostelioides]|eukprot:RKP04300.1 hypothetical protein CXG81DRAFT_8412 [Caulochytrium protostelioides]
MPVLPTAHTAELPAHVVKHLPWPSADPDLAGVAVTIKTGADVLLERTPIQLVSFLGRFPQIIVIGEDDAAVGPLPMYDVVSHTYEEMGPLGNLTQAPRRELQKHGKLVLDVDTTPPRDRSLGWQKDAHKNLPGFRLMATTFPDAEWYFMIDDDTYVFHSNLKRLLAKYNPNDRHYIGTITIFVGCDNVQEWGAGPDFAHGGAGILVSRGAMNRMMTGIDYCIGRYQTCWAGDIRTALCMRDHGIKLEPSNQFHKENPGSRNWQYPDNPCDEPITFHHLSVAQVQLLYLYESRFLAKHPGQPYTLGDVLADWETDRVVPNQDRPGNDIASLRTETPKLCRTACIDKSGCVAWSWVDHGCYLKKSISAPVERKDAASGVLPQKYQCRRSPSI